MLEELSLSPGELLLVLFSLILLFIVVYTALSFKAYHHMN
jgi:hypothetical protein